MIHWVDLYCGPITFQIRDRLGLKSTVTLLSRTHQTAVAVFLDGARPALGLGPAGLGTPPADTAAASVRSDTASRMSSRQIVLPDTWGAKDVQT